MTTILSLLLIIAIVSFLMASGKFSLKNLLNQTLMKNIGLAKSKKMTNEQKKDQDEKDIIDSAARKKILINEIRKEYLQLTKDSSN